MQLKKQFEIIWTLRSFAWIQEALDVQNLIKCVVLPVALVSLYTFAFPIDSSMLSFKKVVGVTTVHKQSPHVDRGGILQQ